MKTNPTRVTRDRMTTTRPDQTKKNTLIVICGPTGVGKTAIGIGLARELKTEIVSADSRQIYRDMKIGTACPTEAETALAPHHLFAFLDPSESYSAARFAEDAIKILDDLFSRRSIALMVGGSGMYIDALCHGFDEIPETDLQIREKINVEFETAGLGALQARVASLDPDYYATVDRNNPRRLIRALEVIDQTGKTYTHFRSGKKIEQPFNIVKIGLDLPREQLYERIDARVDQMIENGLREEVNLLYPKKHLNALNAVGYPELFQVVDGTLSLEDALALMKQNTRRFAKRQLTWFKKDKEITWFSPNEPDAVMDFVRISVA